MNVKQHLNEAIFRFEITKLADISVWRQTIVFFSGNLSREFHVANAYSKDREDLLAYVDNDLIGRWKFCDEEVREALKNLSIMRTSKRKGFKMLSTSSAAWREPVHQSPVPFQLLEAPSGQQSLRSSGDSCGVNFAKKVERAVLPMPGRIFAIVIRPTNLLYK